MYHHCLFCSSHLGTNEIIEQFPVGRTLAFDRWKGRLWVVCPHCQRWNLAPIEERWEAVESAEDRFRATPQRMQYENIGIAHTREGTQLIEVGGASPAELATWRYGRRLRSRRWYHWLNVVGALALGVPGHRGYYLRNKVIANIPAAVAPNRRELTLKWKDVSPATFVLGPQGELTAQIPLRHRPFGVRTPLNIPEPLSQAILLRSLYAVNQIGGSRVDVERAVQLLADLPPHQRSVAWRRTQSDALKVVERWRSGFWRAYVVNAETYVKRSLQKYHLLATEMGLSEETERLAFEGELVALQERWREAEEIAQIADSL